MLVMNFLSLDITRLIGDLKLIGKITELTVIGVHLKHKRFPETFLGTYAERRILMSNRWVKELGFTATRKFIRKQVQFLIFGNIEVEFQRSIFFS